MSLPLFWLVLGVILCLMEMFVPTAFVESTLGISAFIVALVALVLPQFGLQVGLWMVLSLIFIFLLRRFVPKRTPYTLEESTEARTITPILPGETGRVLYEGNSWQARCVDEAVEVPANQPVVVLRRQGNTLFVLPESTLRA